MNMLYRAHLYEQTQGQRLSAYVIRSTDKAAHRFDDAESSLRRTVMNISSLERSPSRCTGDMQSRMAQCHGTLESLSNLVWPCSNIRPAAGRPAKRVQKWGMTARKFSLSVMNSILHSLPPNNRIKDSQAPSTTRNNPARDTSEA